MYSGQPAPVAKDKRVHVYTDTLGLMSSIFLKFMREALSLFFQWIS